VPPLAVWITRVQGVALAGLAIAVVVLSATSTTSLAVAFVASEVVGALLLAVMLLAMPRRRWLRTPTLLMEIIAALISLQLGVDHRIPIAVLVGLPSLVATVGILGAARSED
jgi:hypothetical protein